MSTHCQALVSSQISTSILFLTDLNIILKPQTVEIHASLDLGGGKAMRYSLTPPLVLEAIYLVDNALVHLFNPALLVIWCLLFGT